MFDSVLCFHQSSALWMGIVLPSKSVTLISAFYCKCLLVIIKVFTLLTVLQISLTSMSCIAIILGFRTQKTTTLVRCMHCTHAKLGSYELCSILVVNEVKLSYGHIIATIKKRKRSRSTFIHVLICRIFIRKITWSFLFLSWILDRLNL